MLECIIENWSKILPTLVGLVALVVYYLQEGQKRKEAASLIVLQINELAERIREISGYITEGGIDSVSFYESVPLLETNYWNKYKHYFVNSIDSNSFTAINQFYSYALEIQEQQTFAKELQKNSLVLVQQAINNLEFEFIKNGINSNFGKIDLNGLLSSLSKSMPAGMNEVDKNNLLNFSQLILDQNPGFDINQFWTVFDKQKARINLIFNSRGTIFTNYSPIQIAVSLKKILAKISLLTIIGCDGYTKLEKIANSKAWLLYKM